MRAEKRRKKNPPSEEQRGTRQATNIQSVPALIFCRYLAWQITRNGTSAAEERPAERDVSVGEEKKKSSFYVNYKNWNSDWKTDCWEIQLMQMSLSFGVASVH